MFYCNLNDIVLQRQIWITKRTDSGRKDCTGENGDFQVIL